MSLWVNDQAGAVSSLGDIGNVDISGLADEDILQYDSSSSKWVNVPLSSVETQTLADVLGEGNITDGTDITISQGDKIDNAAGSTSTLIAFDTLNTTANLIDIDAQDLTTGSIARFYSLSGHTDTRNLIEIINDHAGSTGTTALYVQQDSTGLAIDSQGDVSITGKLTVSGLIDPTGLVLTEQAADPASTGAGEGTLWVRSDSPNVLIFTDDAGTDHLIGGSTANTLAAVLLNGNVTGGTDIDISAGDMLTSTANTTTSIRLDPLNTVANVMEIWCDTITNGNLLVLDNDSSNSNSRHLQHIRNNNVAATGAIPLKIEQNSTNGMLEMIEASTTIGNIIDLSEADALTTGSVIYIESDSSDNSTRNLLEIVNTNTAATFAVGLKIEQNSTANAAHILGKCLVQLITTNDSQDNAIGGIYESNLTSNSSNQHVGTFGGAQTLVSATADYTRTDTWGGLAGLGGEVAHIGTGTVTRMSGCETYVYQNGTGTTTDGVCFTGHVDRSTGTLTNAVFLYARDTNGTVSNDYFLKVDSSSTWMDGTSLRMHDGSATRHIPTSKHAEGLSHVITFGADGVGTGDGDRWLYPGYGNSSGNSNEISYFTPRAGRAKNLYIKHGSTPGNGNPIVYTVMLNGTPTSLAVSVDSDVSSGSDLVNEVDFGAGDEISLRAGKASSINNSPKRVVASLVYQ